MSAVQTLRQKRAAPANRGGHVGISQREYFGLAGFANAAEKLGVKTTGITKGPFNRGSLLKMSSGNHDYEVLVDGGSR